MRFEDTPELFGLEVGRGAYADIKCDVCGGKYNEGEDARGVYDNDSVGWTDFGGLTVCGCCFDRIEMEVWRRRKDILAWFARRLNAAQASVTADKAALGAVIQGSGK